MRSMDIDKSVYILKNSSDTRSYDGTDLVVLIKDIWSEKFVIITATVLITALAYAYAYISIATPVYEATVHVLPPPENAIVGFNSGRSVNDKIFKPFTVKDVYTVFTKNLEGASLRQDFFKEVYLPSLPEASRKAAIEQLYVTFSQQLSITADKANPDRYSVAFQNQDLEKAAVWAKAYVERATRVAKAEMILNITQEAAAGARDVKESIEGVREAALLARQDRIIKLKEALRIAESISLTNIQVPSNILVTTTGEVDESLAYLRGSKALAAEISALQSRVSDDAFISNLRKLQSKYDYLNKLSIDPASVSVSRQDGDVEAPATPIKTRKKIIVAAGIVMGLGLGTLIALFRIFFRRYSDTRRSETH